MVRGVVLGCVMSVEGLPSLALCILAEMSPTLGSSLDRPSPTRCGWLPQLFALSPAFLTRM